MYQSPPARTLARLRLLRASSRAMADAVNRAVALVPPADRSTHIRIGRRMQDCGASFSARLLTLPDEPTRLVISHPAACETPSCFLCSRRKAARMRRKTIDLVRIAQAGNPGCALILLTLTVKNRPWRDLGPQLDELSAALDRFWKLPEIRRAFLGHITAFEVVCRGTPDQPEAGAHAHSIVMARREYFDTERNYYLSQKSLVALYQKALLVNYLPILDVRRVRAADGSTGTASIAYAVKEVCKYCVKPQGLFSEDNAHLSADPAVVAVLVKALYRRRMLRVQGAFARANKARNHPDAA